MDIISAKLMEQKALSDKQSEQKAHSDKKLKLKTLSDEQAKCDEATNVATTTTCDVEEDNGPGIEKPDGNEVDNEEVEKVSKKGISITRSLVLFGYESWTALEPCKFIS